MTDSIRLPAAESPTAAFMQAWSDRAKESFNAFLNTAGGQVFFGVDDDGNVVGLEKA